MIVKDIKNFMENFAKTDLIDSWDNSGLQVGNLNDNVKKVLLALDLDDKALDKAIKGNYQMIITHHPLIFKPLKRLTNSSLTERLIIKAIKHNIAIYSAHTNLDMAIGGVNDQLASFLDIIDTENLSQIYHEKLYKLAVFVPRSHEEKIRRAIGDVGAGALGNYSHCTFNIEGIGTFLPKEGSNAYIGEVGKLEEVEEVKIETVVKESLLDKTVTSILSNHPYEEVAYDIYELKNNEASYGYGRIGNIHRTSAIEFLDKIKDKLSIETLIVYGNIDRIISRVAVCGGSGAEFIKNAYSKGADLYLTGDIKYHDAQLAEEYDIIIVDGGHYNTEKIVLPVIKKLMAKEFNNEVIIDIHNESSVTKQFY